MKNLTTYDNVNAFSKPIKKEWKRKYKVFDEPIVDKSCFTTVTDQLKKLVPMTNDEINSHFDFVNGQRDDGRELPLRKGADIAERTERIKRKQAKIAEKIADAQLQAQIAAEAEIHNKQLQPKN